MLTWVFFSLWLLSLFLSFFLFTPPASSSFSSSKVDERGHTKHITNFERDRHKVHRLRESERRQSAGKEERLDFCLFHDILRREGYAVITTMNERQNSREKRTRKCTAFTSRILDTECDVTVHSESQWHSGKAFALFSHTTFSIELPWFLARLLSWLFISDNNNMMSFSFRCRS